LKSRQRSAGHFRKLARAYHAGFQKLLQIQKLLAMNGQEFIIQCIIKGIVK
jgi:hypothetical protein